MGDERNALDVRTLDELRDSLGNDRDFLAELIDEFLADAPDQLATLREAATSGDAEAARRAAHTLKGNGRTFGATELASMCQEAEAAAAAGDLGVVLVHVDEIGAEWERARSELSAVRDGGRDGA